MTRLLEEVFRIASRLPDADQDALAAAILDELKADSGSETRLTESISRVSKLAEEARQEYRGRPHRAARSRPAITR